MKNRLALPSLPQIPPEQKLAESRLNLGMISAVDGADIPSGALTLALNARCRLDRTQRRPGKLANLPAKPDSNKVLLVVLFKKNDASTAFLRFTKNSINRRGVASWTALTPGVNGSLTGGDNDRFTYAVVRDKFFYANGVDKIQEVDAIGNTYLEAGPNSPKVKFVTGFFNRIVGAYRTESTEPNGPVSVVWCADGDTTKWPNDASPDISCGQSPLVESPSDLADFITGIFGGPNEMVVLREKSLWVATKQPVTSQPFYFVNAVPGIGCNAPHSAVMTHAGLAFADTLSNSVWVWAPRSTPERIGTSIEKDLFASVSDPNLIFSDYNSAEFEFSIGVPIPNTTAIKLWTYNFRTKSWVFDEIDKLSEIGDVDAPFSSFLAFDELVGTYDQLVGTFDDLVGSLVGKPARYFGYTNGEIHEEAQNVTDDAGAGFTTELQSKDFYAPGSDAYYTQIVIEYKATQTSTMDLSYSKDGGGTWRIVKTKTAVATSGAKLFRYARQISARRIRWRLRITSGQVDILGYEVHASPGGISK